MKCYGFAFPLPSYGAGNAATVFSSPTQGRSSPVVVCLSHVPAPGARPAHEILSRLVVMTCQHLASGSWGKLGREGRICGSGVAPEHQLYWFAIGGLSAHVVVVVVV
ncbi:hypothetical protein E2C01_019353 [Portunus trituberculatus]|uniref:Uncharacterized protein n=1 Tax=Portunus trituberculatus TaxID=210409 RepID=A0A5B7DYM9_PORTR|nr:hypothetical protein [Portunus trituberculatus]